MRGRKPRPTESRILDGNPGHRPLNTDEPAPPAPEPSSFDVPPVELATDKNAAAEWSRIAPMLRKCRQITEADRGALIAACVEWSRYLEATEKVRSSGLIVKAPSGYPMQNPYLSIASKALSGCTKLWVELGLTPSSRSRVKMAPGAGAGGDDFSEFDQPIADGTITKH